MERLQMVKLTMEIILEMNTRKDLLRRNRSRLDERHVREPGLSKGRLFVVSFDEKNQRNRQQPSLETRQKQTLSRLQSSQRRSRQSRLQR